MLRFIWALCACISLCQARVALSAIQVKEPFCPGYWTDFFDRDNPSGSYDYEALSYIQIENPGKVCANPIGVDARLLNGAHYTTSGEVVTVSPSVGLICKNSNQKDKRCEDYKVRFCCPKAAACPNKEDWTPWFDRDNPSGYYDWEHLSAIQSEYSGVCASPVAVEAQLTNGLPYTDGGDTVVIGPSIGLTCENAAQDDKRCNDYRVRFCCPAVPSPCRKEDWTPWFDRDNPSGSADYEALSILQSENPGKICQQPTGIEVQTVDGAPYTSTGDVLSIGPSIGLICYNNDQDDKRCADYKVRFCCSQSQEPPSCPEGAWTDWFDRDNPSGYGDYELLSNLQNEYPGKICPSPSAADARLLNGDPWTAGGDVAYLTSNGFYCQNADQKDDRCNDYKVRFCCFGESTCPSKNWTQWFDRDNPSGDWDWEGLTSIQNENPGKVCDNPTAVDAQLTNGAPYTSGGDSVSIGPSIGLTCENDAQDDKRCNDYKVRFCCNNVGETPYCPANKWTQWFDRDNAGGDGDWELLSDLQNEYPDRICKNPTAIDAQLLTGAPYTDSGDVVTLSPSLGFYCRNVLQEDGNKCDDYKVRFCCPDDLDFKVREAPKEAVVRQDTRKELTQERTREQSFRRV